MKNKKSLLSLGLLALVAILGVGYAVVSDVVLTITGTASVANAPKVSATAAKMETPKITNFLLKVLLVNLVVFFILYYLRILFVQ